jgi:hypothetical protein
MAQSAYFNMKLTEPLINLQVLYIHVCLSQAYLTTLKQNRLIVLLILNTESRPAGNTQNAIATVMPRMKLVDFTQLSLKLMGLFAQMICKRAHFSVHMDSDLHLLDFSS